MKGSIVSWRYITVVETEHTRKVLEDNLTWLFFDLGGDSPQDYCLDEWWKIRVGVEISSELE
jgi:hypothetical protein